MCNGKHQTPIVVLRRLRTGSRGGPHCIGVSLRDQSTVAKKLKVKPNFNKWNIYLLLSSVIMNCFSFFLLHQKFKNCLKKLDNIDITLEKLGIITNYQQLRRQVIWIVLVWLVIAILLNNVQIISIKKMFDCNNMTAICLSYILNYCAHINLLADLTMKSIIGSVYTVLYKYYTNIIQILFYQNYKLISFLIKLKLN